MTNYSQSTFMWTVASSLSVSVLDDQPRQYWIYANTDNELATIHIKVDCE